MPKLMVRGEWRGDTVVTADIAALMKAEPGFRGRIESDGAFAPASGRYHLYGCYGCPFAHRAILVRALKKLDDVIALSVVHPRWNDADGWRFEEGPHSTIDHANGFRFLREAYARTKPDYTGRVTVPVLWDRIGGRIVNAASIDLVRNLGSAFDAVGGDPAMDLYPDGLRVAIDALNATVVGGLAARVYAVADAPDQDTYEREVRVVFDTLDALEVRLGDGRAFLFGDRPVETDVLLFPALMRFDVIYNPLFRCSLARLVDYPRLSAWTRRFHDLPGVAATVKIEDALMHYWDDWTPANRRIVPLQPRIDFRSAR